MFLIGDHNRLLHTTANTIPIRKPRRSNKRSQGPRGGNGCGRSGFYRCAGLAFRRFRLDGRIDAKVRGLVRTDSVATIATEGVVGGTLLGSSRGQPQALPAVAFATIPAKSQQKLQICSCGVTRCWGC